MNNPIKKKIFKSLIASLILSQLCIPIAQAAQFTYTIKSGDSLWNIAATYGTTTNQLMLDNNITDSNNIYVGEPLKISFNGFYTVKSGDSLYSIAKKYFITTTDLINYNKLSSTNIYIGQVLRLVPNDVVADLNPAENYIGMQKVSLKVLDANTIIYYSIGDSAPTISQENLYDGKPIILNKSTTITAIAVKDKSIGNAVNFKYNILNPPAPTVYSQNSTKITDNNGTFVSLGCDYSNSAFYYTLDGSIPSKNNGFIYSGGFYIGQNYIGKVTLKAISYEMNSGFPGLASDVTQKDFHFIPNSPSFNLKAIDSNGSPLIYTTKQSVTLSSPNNASIYYTLDGSDPSINSSKYSLPIDIDKNTLIKAICVKNGETSPIAQSNYIINIPPNVINTPNPNIQSKSEVAKNSVLYFSTNDINATIYYTLDGSTPNIYSKKYNSSTGISLDHSYTVKAIAINGAIKSSVSENFYNVDEMTGFTMRSPYTNYDIFYGQGYTLDYLFRRFGTMPNEVKANNTWISTSLDNYTNLYNQYGYNWVTFPVRRYKINPNDSLHSIALKGGFSVDDIIKINNMKSDTIYEGQYVYLPKTGYNTNEWSMDKNSIAIKSSAPSTIFPPTWVTSDPRYNSTTDDMYWLKQIIEAESGGEPYAGQQGVGIVIMNRLALKKAQFPNYNITLKDIIFEYSRTNEEEMYPSNQFQPIINETIYNVTPGSTIGNAAYYAYSKNYIVNYNNTNYNLSQALFFINPVLASSSWINNNCTLIAIIKNHNFYSQNGVSISH